MRRDRMAPPGTPSPFMPGPESRLPPPSTGPQMPNAEGKGDLPFSYPAPKVQDRLPQSLSVQPRPPVQNAPLQGEVIPPAGAQPASGSDAPAPATFEPPDYVRHERSIVRDTAMALLRKGSAAERVQALTMLSQLERPTAEETTWKERQRLLNAVTNSPADDSAKARARTAVELGAKPDDVLEVLGLDAAGQKASRETQQNVNAELTKALGGELEGAVINRSKARIDDLIDNSYWSTGLSGFGPSYIPNTDAYQLSHELSTFKAIVGFDRLEQMREESKTGGALGQVTERELTFLQATQGSLDQFQDPAILKENVADIAQAHQAFRQLRQLVKAAEMGDTSVLPDIARLGKEINEIGTAVTLRSSSDTEVPPAEEGAEFESKY